jgi:hypothetical protein
MPGFAIGNAIGLAAAIWLLPAAARAECKELQQFIKDETAGEEKYVDTFSFRRNHRADSVLMLVKATVEKGRLPKRWLFLHRDDATSSELCVAGRGEFFGQHEDDHESDPAATFGPPGSTSPNCATSTPNVDASDELRAWANHDLGESIILYTASRDTPGYQFVIGKDRDWIIIEDQSGPPKQSCFFDRGTDVMMRFNIKLIEY